MENVEVEVEPLPWSKLFDNYILFVKVCSQFPFWKALEDGNISKLDGCLKNSTNKLAMMHHHANDLLLECLDSHHPRCSLAVTECPDAASLQVPHQLRRLISKIATLITTLNSGEDGIVGANELVAYIKLLLHSLSHPEAPCKNCRDAEDRCGKAVRNALGGARNCGYNETLNP